MELSFETIYHASQRNANKYFKDWIFHDKLAIFLKQNLYEDCCNFWTNRHLQNRKTNENTH